MLKDLKKRFNEEGFVVVKDVFKAPEIEFYRQVVKEAIKERKQLDLRTLEDKSEYEQYISRRKLKQDEVSKVDNLERDISTLRNEITEIKDMLRSLVNGN